MQRNEQENPSLKIIAVIVLVAMVTRITGPSFGNNFAPMNAIALFSGAYFVSPLVAVAVPLLSIVIGDYAVNYLYAGDFSPLYPGWYWQYVSYVLLACLGMLLRNRVRPLNVLGTTFAGAVLFFAISNFGVWLSAGLYPPTWDGLVTCFALAIPFFKNTVYGDLFFVTLMFGACELFQRLSVPSRRPAAV